MHASGMGGVERGMGERLSPQLVLPSTIARFWPGNVRVLQWLAVFTATGVFVFLNNFIYLFLAVWFFLNNFIYLFLAMLGLHYCVDYSLVAVCRLLIAGAFLVATYRLEGTRASVVVARGL